MNMVRRLILLVAIACHLPAFADTGATPEQAREMVRKAVEHVKSVGPDKAAADFNAGSPPFLDRDLYVVMWDMNGVSHAQYPNPRMNGRNLSDLKDADGRPLGQMLLDTGRKGGKGWVEYRFLNPVSKQLELKRSYVERVGDFIVFCGVYKN